MKQKHAVFFIEKYTENAPVRFLEHCSIKNYTLFLQLKTNCMTCFSSVDYFPNSFQTSLQF